MQDKIPILLKYPQASWAIQIVKTLKAIGIKPSMSIVDAPCGNGIIAYLVKKSMPENEIFAFDIDEKSLESKYLKDATVPIVSWKADVFKEGISGSNNVWLLVNSIYCLPESQSLIDLNKPFYKWIVAIVPDISKSNFKYFTSRHPEFDNSGMMSLDNTIDLFNINGYELVVKRGLTRVPFHKWNERMNKLMIPPILRNLIFNLIDKLSFYRDHQYQLLAFLRK